MNENHYATQLQKHLEEKGIEGLLPQNLTNELLHRLISEGEYLAGIANTKTSVLTLFVVLTYLVNASTRKEEIEIDEIQMKYLKPYLITLVLEDMRRDKEIEIPYSSLPNIDNIFNENRDTGIKE